MILQSKHAFLVTISLPNGYDAYFRHETAS